MQDTPPPELFTIVERLGGWGAFLIALLWGGRSFMALARDFSQKVTGELGSIRQALVSWEGKVTVLTDRLGDLADTVKEQSTRLEKLSERVKCNEDKR